MSRINFNVYAAVGSSRLPDHTRNSAIPTAGKNTTDKYYRRQRREAKQMAKALEAQQSEAEAAEKDVTVQVASDPKDAVNHRPLPVEKPV